jgi:signal transduction histidine kinase
MSYFLAGFVLEPLNKLIVGVKRVRDGEYPVKIDVGGDNEIALLAESFNKLTEELRKKEEMERVIHHQDKLAMVGQLAAGIAHEIRNPLVSIRSLSEMLRDEVNDRESIEIIIGEVDRINLVIEQLLNYSKPGSKRVEKCDVGGIVNGIFLLVKANLKKKNIKMDIVLNHRGMILVCRDELFQILLNLVVNSIEAVKDGMGRIEIGTNEENGRLSIHVRDNGIGIDEKNINRIFKPFFSNRGSNKGTGMGLAVVKRLVEENGGEISVRSKKGEGSVFSISFPVVLG